MTLSKKILFLFAVQLVTLATCNICATTANQEVAYLQTDRTTYIAGESVYYKLYVLDSETKKCSGISKVGYVLLRSSGSGSSLKVRVRIDAGMASGSILLPDTLASGAYQLVAFTSAMRNSGDQGFFYQDITIANRYDKDLKFKLVNSIAPDSNYMKPHSIQAVIKTDKKVYGLREKVVVNLENMASKANVSVSVSEVPPLIVSPKTFAETLNGLSFTTDNKQKLIYHSPETKAKIMNGRVLDAMTNNVVSEAVVLLSCNDTIPNLQYAVTNSDGKFQLLLNDYYDGKELFLTIRDVPVGQQWKIETEDEYAQNELWNPSLMTSSGDFRDYIAKSQNLVYINKSYQLNTDGIEKPVSIFNPVCPRFYHSTGTTILPSDFVSLDDFPEIVVEILPQVVISRDKGKPRIKVYNTLIKMFNNNSPAIFLDGVFVDDINKILGLGSEQIEKIDVLEVERAFGDLVFSGVISIVTKSNEILNTKPALHSLRLKNDRVNTGSRIVTVSPDQIQNKDLPLFKQLLYWNPGLELKGRNTTDLEFYTSDNTATYLIKIEGISENGSPISSSSCIQVINQPNVTDK